jgi:hypothetical protein
LTIRNLVAKCITRSFISVGRVAGFDGAACAAEGTLKRHERWDAASSWAP